MFVRRKKTDNQNIMNQKKIILLLLFAVFSITLCHSDVSLTPEQECCSDIIFQLNEQNKILSELTVSMQNNEIELRKIEAQLQLLPKDDNNMANQFAIMIPILAALLTGGFLMIFIESQQVSRNMNERFHFKMNPFFHSFSNYVKFMSSFKSCFTFKITEDSEYIKKLKDNVEEVGRLGGQSILSGQDFPADYFTGKELDSICRTISNIWGLVDKNYDYVNKHLDFDSRHAEMFSQHIKDYLGAISPKYKGMPLTKDMLAKVSGEFYDEIYQPIKHILPQYESWQEKEKEFRILTFFTIVFTLLTMLLILLLSCFISMWIYNILCITCCGLLLFGLYKLIKLEDISKKIMR